MELTPERKQQIEEEERQRLAEEQHRAQVRAGLNAGTGPHVPPSMPRAAQPKAAKSTALAWVLGILAAVVLVIVWAAIRADRAKTSPPASDNPRAAAAIPVPTVHTPVVRYVPVTQKIATGQIVVRPKGYVRYRLQIADGMLQARVSGHFNASGGTGNDIEAVIATEDEFTNWINGHPANVFYSTQGKKTTDTFDVRLAPGTYILAFSNTFSAMSAKDVFLEADLSYQRMETY